MRLTIGWAKAGANGGMRFMLLPFTNYHECKRTHSAQRPGKVVACVRRDRPSRCSPMTLGLGFSALGV